ncbi:MAG: hypothetical protein LBE03_00950 [Candidatus Nomurabacteria bacterium]|jgi:ABC-type transport system involved in multi-copper enzyme maturation permease subunit|nr:hypothetical protein [Candidatus Nomurabacteria bacterium]
MLNYLHAEIYRLFRKKSLFIFSGLALLAYLVTIFIRSGNLNSYSILKDASDLFSLLPPIVGGVLFAAIYTDDLSSKNLSTLVGFGLSKSKIVVAKLILALMTLVLIFGLLPLLMYLIYAGLGWAASGNMMANVYLLSGRFILLVMIFMAFAGVVVYGFQRSTAAIVAYLLLSLGAIGQLLTLILDKILPNASQYLPSNIIGQLHLNLMTGEGAIVWLGMGLLAYVVMSIIVSVMLFNKKEMEF